MDNILDVKLRSKGAVVIEGPKWCGKTTTAEQVAATVVVLAKENVRTSFANLIEIDPDSAFEGNTPILIDEWQTVPKLRVNSWMPSWSLFFSITAASVSTMT